MAGARVAATPRPLLAALAAVTAGCVALLVVVVVVVAGRSSGVPVAAERIDVLPGGAVPVRVVDGAPQRGDLAVASVLADLQRFWAATLPASAGRPFEALRSGYASVDSVAGTAGALCVSTPSAVAGNAFYCPAEDGIVYDSATLVPVLLDHYGSPALAASLAHEFGHAVQARIGPTQAQRDADPARYPSILVEAQADCDAGAFLAWAAAGRSELVHLPPSSMLRAVSPLLEFRDPADGRPDESAAHGLGLDRLRFVLTGYRGGAGACSAMTTAGLDLTLGRVRGADLSAPRYATVQGLAAATRASVGSFAGVQTVPSASPGDLAAAAPYGQFAAATSSALALGRQLYGSSAGAACFAGAWTASVFGTAPAGALGGWPGDADEALDLVRSRPGATFDDVAAFADGFDGGRSACG